MLVKPQGAKRIASAAPVPRGAKRRQAIVAVAEAVFLSFGFSETTMQQIALEAGASKETLYRHFGSKEALLVEVINNRARILRSGLKGDFAAAKRIDTVLRDLGIALLVVLTSPEVTALLRIIIAAVPRDPKLGEIFFTAGPERTRKDLAEFLEAARQRGEFSGRDSELAASIFIGAVLSQCHLTHLVLSKSTPLDMGQIESRVEEVVGMFMAYYGA